jgi:legumain
MFTKVMTELKPSDKVFVYFSDHGAPGLLAFPKGYLYADQIQSMIATMQQKKLFNRMIFYVEACESGSLFPNLTNNVFAMTASNSTASSWAAYCSPEDTVNGVSIGACLADEFSANWMADNSTNFISQI